MQNDQLIPKKIFLAFFILALFFGAFVFYQSIKFNDNKLHVVFCNVGQGDSIFIRSPKGIDMLVDGGPDDLVVNCLSNHMPFWDRKIEMIISTHPDVDHFKGLIDVLKRYEVDSIYLGKEKGKAVSYQELLSLIKTKNITARSLQKGDNFYLKDKVVLQTISPISYPEHDVSLDIDTNALSIIELLTYNRFSLLLTGDGKLSSSQFSQNIDVLKVSHHGSKNNTNLEFLEAIRPELAVISVGKKNRYGHPTKEVLNMLGSLGIKTLRTDLDGEVEVISDGNKWAVSN